MFLLHSNFYLFMKNINTYKYIVGAFLTLNFTSCADFLDREPLDEVSNTTFWNTEDDMKIYNNNLYALASNCASTGIMVSHSTANTDAMQLCVDFMSDNMATTHASRKFFNEIKSGLRPVPDNPDIFGYQGWDFLRAVNFGLENYDRTQVTQTVKNKYIAEAKLFRGWFYGVKVQRYGDVQWIDKPLSTDSPELYGERTPRKTVMENVLNDLTFACENLPDDWGDGSTPGRMNRWCALLIKSRICLFEGTFRKYHNIEGYESWLTEARDAAYEIIQNGPYSLYKTSDPVGNEDFAFIYRQKDLTGNPQVLYWKKYVQGIITHNAIKNFTGCNGGATRDMVESYLMIDGKPIGQSSYTYSDETIEKVFENRDPRLRMSILHPDDVAKRNFFLTSNLSYPRLLGMAGGKISNTGYHIIKPYNNDVAEITYGQETQAGVILQYAEVLLNYIEAKAELDINSVTQEDLDITVNALRDRAGMENAHLWLTDVPHDPKNVGELQVSDLIYEIRRERRVEFLADGLRYDDLMRWGWGKKLTEKAYGMRWDDAAKARFPEAKLIKSSIDPENGIEYIDVYKGTQYENPKFDPAKDYLWPIPISVMAENDNISQNPGWGN